ncbi:TRAP transporter small permease [Azospirillum sp. ST 5-10]|uniref:TRAP transporter small permease n=1 Tax=unclassified Azospirillum TaxID=2630922 RepID=UPI003F49B5D4
MTFESLRLGFERLLEVIVVLLVALLTLLIIAGFVFRYLGSSLVWYDEVASVGLAWLTYYGAALAALKGAHIGFPGIVNAFPPGLRLAATVFAEGCVFLFFGVLAWTGWEVVVILEGDTLVSLPWVPLQLSQSVIPVGAVLFMLAEAMRLPKVLRDARGAGFADHEIEEALGADAARLAARPARAAAAPLRGTMVQGGQRP